MNGRLIQFVRTHRWKLGIAGVLLLATFMRFWRLDSLPPGLHPDEAANGLDIFRITEDHDLRPFYPTNGGREALFFYLQAIGVKLVGNTTLGLRLAPALIGVLACGAVYLWIKSWFGRREGLIAALLMAVTPWAVTISRDGFRAGMVALMVPLTVWLYTKALQTGKLWWYAAAGVSLGAGFYTYIAFRLFPLILVAAFGFALLWRRQQLKRWTGGIAVSLVAMGITLLPMAWYTTGHFGEVISRSGGVSFTNPGLNHGHPIQTLGQNVVKTALMFNLRGDNNYRQNLGGQPELNIFVGAMFLLGILVCITHIRRLRYFGVLLVFAVMLLPEVLTAEGIPHALRAIGALPAALALAAIGIGYLIDRWKSVFPLNTAARFAGQAAIALLLTLSVYHGYVQYFVAWANSPETYEAYSEDISALANYYTETPVSAQRYALGGSYGFQALQYLTHNRVHYTQMDPKVFAKQRPIPGPIEFAVLHNDKNEVLAQLKAQYPKGRLTPHYSSFSGNELFITYTVPAS